MTLFFDTNLNVTRSVQVIFFRSNDLKSPSLWVKYDFDAKSDYINNFITLKWSEWGESKTISNFKVFLLVSLFWLKVFSVLLKMLFLKKMPLQYYDAVPTKMRLNSLYNKIYCVLLNSLFATVIPLASLFYLNVCIVIGKRICIFVMTVVEFHIVVHNSFLHLHEYPKRIYWCLVRHFD